MQEPAPLGVDDILQAERTALAAGATTAAPTSALCISGGGIRSATFALGALQGMAEHGLLKQFDYLSTVSGGGYIGGWLSAWKQRAGSVDKVAAALRRDATPATDGTSDPLQHLRDYNSYLTPRAGAFSSDLWTVIATVARNILLNWIVLIPLLMAALMLPRLYLSALSFPELFYGATIFAGSDPDYSAPILDAISESAWVELYLPLISCALLTTALFNTLRYLPGVGARSHSRQQYVLGVLLPLVGSVLLFLMFDSLYYLGQDYVAHTNLPSVVLWASVPCISAWLIFLLFHRQPLTTKLRLLFGPMSLAIAVMAAGIGLATWAATNFLLWNSDPHLSPSWAEYVSFGPATILLGYCLGSVLFAGLSSSFLRDEDREWMARATGGVLLFCVAWSLIGFMVLVLPKWALDWHPAAHGGIGLGALLSAWLSTLGGGDSSNSNPGAERPSSRVRALAVIAHVAPPVFLLVLAGALSILTNIVLQGLHNGAGMTLSTAMGLPVHWTEHYAMLTRAQPLLVLLLTVGLLLLSWLMARWVNINTFSLHGMYRDRLIRAYLGASNPKRRASAFTGFCSGDDVPMAALDPTLRPFHVVNLTLNLVAGQRLAWQQRKATSFTVSPLHSGSADLGYRPSAEYAGGISLGTAVAISGAAASPNMGYHSSAVVGFIMSLFNARLGAWLGNPGPPGARTWKDAGPRAAIASLIREALGQTSDASAYVYLSDGGHFENLGLYEMVRRRCQQIVVLDSGCDPTFSCDDLGNALRKIRIDQRVAIEFDEVAMRDLRAGKCRSASAVIRYSLVDSTLADGKLVYIKPVLLGSEPPDVLSYAASQPDFPHQSTADQWFDESQTESYRMLGLTTLDELCRSEMPTTLGEWMQRAHARQRTPEPAVA